MSFNFKGDIPQSVNIEENAKFGEKLRRDSWTKTGAILDFYEHVKSGGLMDYKTKGGSQYENFGNYNYGVVAQAMEIDKNFCKSSCWSTTSKKYNVSWIKKRQKMVSKIKRKR